MPVVEAGRLISIACSLTLTASVLRSGARAHQAPDAERFCCIPEAKRILRSVGVGSGLRVHPIRASDWRKSRSAPSSTRAEERILHLPSPLTLTAFVLRSGARAYQPPDAERLCCAPEANGFFILSGSGRGCGCDRLRRATWRKRRSAFTAPSFFLRRKTDQASDAERLCPVRAAKWILRSVKAGYKFGAHGHDRVHGVQRSHAAGGDERVTSC